MTAQTKPGEGEPDEGGRRGPGLMPTARAGFIIALGFLVLALLFAGWQWTRAKQAPVATSGTVASSGTALVGGPFELVDQHGQTRGDADFRGRYMLIYFGYTFCPDICPMTLLNMSEGLEQLAADEPEAAAAIVPLFITVDPERDTVEAMADYAPSFHPDLVALTGSAEQVAGAAEAYRVYYAKVPEEEASDDYLMDHSSYIFLMGPDGDYLAHFSHQSDPGEIARGLAAQIKEN